MKQWTILIIVLLVITAVAIAIFKHKPTTQTTEKKMSMEDQAIEEVEKELEETVENITLEDIEQSLTE
ncbi:MAG: hypothetical protein J7K98_01230 [Candidatus Aenigmarchaeota archaeon]|nr:hypothetical protein [Candidatus Aenigmarchaeota archaeon]